MATNGSQKVKANIQWQANVTATDTTTKKGRKFKTETAKIGYNNNNCWMLKIQCCHHESPTYNEELGDDWP